MSIPQFLELSPVLPVRNVSEAMAYYTDKLGFTLRFTDDAQNPKYAGVARGAASFHLQWHEPADFRENVDTAALRFVIDDVDGLFAEYSGKNVFQAATALRDTPWGTREFAFYDLDGNGLFFYYSL